VAWFQPPQLRIGEGIEEESRRATWLELFYDLVFVVAVSQVAHNLSADLSLPGFLGFVALFLPIWWAWIGATFYANRFDMDDVGHRLLTAVQILAVAAMAINIHYGLGETSAGFALSYVAVRVVLVFQYLRAAQHVSSARELAMHHAVGFAIAALLWLISAFVPMPLRFVLWAAGLTVDFATPLMGVQHQARLLPDFEHLPERFGLFVIIVLGEAIVGVVEGVSGQKWDAASVIAAILGFSIAFSLWWIYFENVGGSALRATRTISVLQVWLYGHLPLVIGMAGTGVAVERIISSNPMLPLPSAERWLLCGCVTLCFLSLAILHQIGVIFRCKMRSKYRFISAIAVLLLAIIGSGLQAIMVIGLVAIVSAVQVAQDLYQGHPASSSADGQSAS
jgi:low temperature requirement protein LtrA